jgi:hypothetical protein
VRNTKKCTFPLSRAGISKFPSLNDFIFGLDPLEDLSPEGKLAPSREKLRRVSQILKEIKNAAINQ